MRKKSNKNLTKHNFFKYRTIAGYGELLKAIRTVIINILILSVIIFLCIFIYNDLNIEKVIIEEFDVPNKFQEIGLSGRVVSKKLLDKLTNIRQNATSSVLSYDFQASWIESPQKVEIPSVGLSVQSINNFLRDFLGKGTIHVLGEVVMNDRDHTSLTIRIHGQNEISLSGRFSELDSLLFEAAKYLQLRIQPYILAYYFLSTNPEECLNTIKYCLLNDPENDDPWVYNLWGILLSNQGNYEEAIVKYQKSINFNPRDARVFFNWGSVLSKQIKYDEAIDKFKIAIKLDPKFSEAYNNWGNILYRKKNYDQAIEKYRSAIERNPKISTIHFNLGKALYNSALYDQAVVSYNNALELEPENPGIYFDLGCAFEALGSHNKALDQFIKSLNLNPDSLLQISIQEQIKSIQSNK